MSPRLLKFIVFTAGFAVLAFVVERQRETTAALREKAERLRADQAELARLRSEHEALNSEQVSPAELAQLRDNQAEAARLRAEALLLRSKKPAPHPATEAVPRPVAAKLPAAETWHNAGRATPDATFQTSVWAALHGETDTLTNLLGFDAAGRAIIDDQFARLPAEVRATYGSAEKVFATLVAIRLPQDLTAFEPLARKADSPDDVTIHMRLTRTDQSTRETDFHFTRAPEGWHIVVPNEIVKKYSAMLTASPSSLERK